MSKGLIVLSSNLLAKFCNFSSNIHRQKDKNIICSIIKIPKFIKLETIRQIKLVLHGQVHFYVICLKFQKTRSAWNKIQYTIYCIINISADIISGFGLPTWEGIKSSGPSDILFQNIFRSSNSVVLSWNNKKTTPDIQKVHVEYLVLTKDIKSSIYHNGSLNFIPT